jgi:hypothetical protein
MNNRLIDILQNKALKTTGDVFVTLNPTTKNWDLSSTSDASNIQSHVIDRSDLKASITSAVTELAALLPADH